MIFMYNVKLRVHITPIGFELDRVILPLVDMKADKVWLISKEESRDKAKPYKDKIIARLKKLKINYDCTDCEITDMYDILRSMRMIIEKEYRNDIFINVSSGSKIAAIAGMMASMIFKDRTRIIPYYVEPMKYPGETKRSKPQSEGLKEIQILPDYKIEQPEPHLISILKIIEKCDGCISKKELIQNASKDGLITVGGADMNRKQSEYMCLNKNYIEPLVSWGLITVQKIGRRKKIMLTKEGQNMLKFLD